MTTRRARAALVTLLLAAVAAIAAPATAGAQPADPCMLGASNVGPRTCVTTNFATPPAFTLGNGICAAMVRASGNGFDGPLWQYSEAPGAMHGIIVRITQGFSPLGEWAPSVLTCDMTAVVDWRNLDTGASGSESRHMPWLAQPSVSPTIVPLYTGPGRVQITLRTAHPNIPASTEVFVP